MVADGDGRVRVLAIVMDGVGLGALGVCLLLAKNSLPTMVSISVLQVGFLALSAIE